MERKKNGERSGEREKGEWERERDEESMRERDRWGSEWLRERGRLLKREREKKRGEWERERERRGEYENRGGKEKSLKKQMYQNCMSTMNVNTL